MYSISVQEPHSAAGFLHDDVCILSCHNNFSTLVSVTMISGALGNGDVSIAGTSSYQL